ncbi:MAG: hypothetical protein WAV32_05680 [Halobacteriota archaeon]
MFGKAGMRWLWSITSKLTELDQFIFDAELRHIETLKGLIKEVETRIAKELAESEDVKLLVGIPVPGVNYYTALLLTSEIGDFSRRSLQNKVSKNQGTKRRWKGNSGNRKRNRSGDVSMPSSWSCEPTDNAVVLTYASIACS